jgi:hypothetical protein
MFESRERLEEEIQGLLGALRHLGSGRYACVVDPRGVLLDESDPEGPATWPLRRFLEERAASLFAIPGALASGEPLDDAFAAFEDEEFFLAFVNGRVGLVVACPRAEDLRERGGRLLGALVDRLLRYNTAWRVDEKGRGFFFTRPRLDTVVIGRAEGSEAGAR